MKRSQVITGIATALALTFSIPPIASGEETDIAINVDDYRNQKTPDGMFWPIETLLGFSTSFNISHRGLASSIGTTSGQSAVFQPCSTDIKEYCIESASWRKLGSDKWISGSVTDWRPNPSDPALTAITGEITTGSAQYRDFFINPDTGLPIGGHTKVWNLPGATHGGGDNYTVTFWAVVSSDNSNATLSMQIKPVKFDKLTHSGGTWPFGYGTIYNFPTNVEYQAKVRIGKIKEKISGWWNGRILDPSMTQEGSTITLSGTPARVLTAHTGPISCENRPMLESYKERCIKKDPSLASPWVAAVTLSHDIGSATPKPDPVFPNGRFAYYESVMKPIGFSSEWNALSWNINGTGNCQIEPGKIALISSNATLYSLSPPVWDETEQTLAYRVGSLHLDHKGALHKGHFNLAVPKNFAKCLWGENILNAKATVVVTNADGTNNVATSVLSQDDQMIYFKVAGFTFSTPQIKVKLEIPKVLPTPTPTPTPTATPTPTPVVKKSTISCVKGKTIKKVTAVKPKCPAGFKKK